MTLDIGLKSGWTVAPIGGKLIGGTHRFAPVGADHAMVFGRAMQFVSDQINLHRPAVVVVEFNRNAIAGKQASGRTNIDVILVHGALRGIVMGVCNVMGVRCREVAATDARKSFIGKWGAGLKRDEAKAAVKRECIVRGIEFVDDNHADAIALHFHQAFLMDPDYAARDAVARMRMRDPFLSGAA